MDVSLDAITGECGIRGGYVELINLEPEVRAMYQKSISAQLCPTTVGQAAIDVVVNPPKKGEPSYEQFQREKIAVLSSLKERAKLVADTFNSFEGFSCNKVQGAMYAFPQIQLPAKAVEAAKQVNQSPDTFYAFQLLEETGERRRICLGIWMDCRYSRLFMKLHKTPETFWNCAHFLGIFKISLDHRLSPVLSTFLTPILCVLPNFCGAHSWFVHFKQAFVSLLAAASDKNRAHIISVQPSCRKPTN